MILNTPYADWIYCEWLWTYLSSVNPFLLTGKVYKLHSPSVRYLAFFFDLYDPSNTTKCWAFPELAVKYARYPLKKISWKKWTKIGRSRCWWGVYDCFTWSTLHIQNGNFYEWKLEFAIQLLEACIISLWSRIWCYSPFKCEKRKVTWKIFEGPFSDISRRA